MSVFMFGSVLSALAWGQKGHDVTAYIAENHLTPVTACAVDSLLEGKSMVYWANWLDNASHTEPYAYTKTWHYKNVDEGERYEESYANPAGDAVTAIKAQIETLTHGEASLEDSQLAMKILVHVVGDLHQPLHMGHATDLGGNRTKVKYFGRDTNLHSVWDSSIPESAHKWSYTEWQQQIDRVPQAKQSEIVSGSIDDWAKQTITICDDVYKYFAANPNISYDGVADWTPVVETQFLNGGLRLAHILNLIFDKDYRAANPSPVIDEALRGRK
ncbi:MAG: S1/P1 nuclease [Duncaniella sp.]|nr:S1/P1 nuclease [Duncaniella sp.]